MKTQVLAKKLIILGVMLNVAYLATVLSLITCTPREKQEPKDSLTHQWFEEEIIELSQKEDSLILFLDSIKQLKEAYQTIDMKYWDSISLSSIHHWDSMSKSLTIEFNEKVKDYNKKSDTFDWSKVSVDTILKRQIYIIE